MRTLKFSLLATATVITCGYSAALFFTELPASARGLFLVVIALLWVAFMTVSIQQTVRDTINLRMERTSDETMARIEAAKKEVVAEIAAQFQKVDLIRSVARELGRQQQELQRQQQDAPTSDGSGGGDRAAESSR